MLNVSLEECIQLIREKLKDNQQIRFQDLFDSSADKLVLVMTFIAILELIKQKIIKATQANPFADIYIHRKNGQNAN